MTTFAETAAGKKNLDLAKKILAKGVDWSEDPPRMVQPIANHIESIWVWPGGWSEHVADAPVGALEFSPKDDSDREDLEAEIDRFEEDDAEEQRRLGDLTKDLCEAIKFAVKEVCDEHEKQIYP